MAPADDNPLKGFTSVLGQKDAPPLPDPQVMVEASLKILKQSEAGEKLFQFAVREKLIVKIIKTRHETTYIPETRELFIGVTSNSPTLPTRFVLMLAGAIREAEQDFEGLKRPSLNQPLNDIIRLSTAKEADKVAYMCLIAYELEQLPNLNKMKFLDELRAMGYGETVDIFLKNL
jgi:hypothetical protein